MSAEAVPTPALLPGLLAMGAAALRKRGDEEEETLDAEV
ncbi:PTPA-CTERM sorting domain-containing protein [Thermoleptolyngbya sp.]